MEAPPYCCAKVETLAPRVVVMDTWMVVASLLLGKNESLHSPVCFLWHHLSRDRESPFPTAECRWKSRLSICSPLGLLGLEGAYYQPVGMRVLVPYLDSLTPPLQGCWGASSQFHEDWSPGSSLDVGWIRWEQAHSLSVMFGCNRAVIAWKFSVLIGCPFPG